MLTALLTSVLASGLNAPVLDAPPKLTIMGYKHLGKGCPPGSLRLPAHSNTQNDALRFELGDLRASWYPGSPLVESRSNCQVDVQYDIPDGWQLAVSDISMEGRLWLTANVTAQVNTRLKFGGQDEAFTHQHILNDPEANDFHILIAPEKPLWSRCGGVQLLSINVAARVNPLAPNLDASHGGEIEFTYDLDAEDAVFKYRWRRCQPASPAL